ncbi:hypothetical protein L2E82_02800 [Cichorium intybus]|uniref:Uncharacterized protein n=1 Tax=Cichorium intybus TaxID=13427 RepID=A0ACB9H3U8_CICIN|nr:hypothetical protein L2E82_02800 [Cichorium intybus]
MQVQSKMAPKILETTINFAVGFKRSSLIRPRITVWKCYGNSRNRVYKTRAASNNFGPPIWRETVKVECPMPTSGDATLVFQLTDIFRRKLGQATVPMNNITEDYNISFPLVSREGQTLGSLVLTLRLIDHTQNQPTTTNEKATDRRDIGEQLSSTLDAFFGAVRACASFENDLLD